MPAKRLTVPEAAKLLGLSTARVRALCAQGRIAADKVGRDWIIAEAKILPGLPCGEAEEGEAMLTYKITDRPGLRTVGDQMPRIEIGGVDITGMVADYSVSASGVSLTLHLAAVEATGMGVVYVRGVEAPVRAGIDAIRADCIRILEATGGDDA